MVLVSRGRQWASLSTKRRCRRGSIHTPTRLHPRPARTGPAPAAVLLGVLLQRAGEHRCAGEEGGDLCPHLLFCVAVIGKELRARRRGAVLLLRLEAAVVDGELLEVRQNRERQPRRPGVAPELDRRGHVARDVNRGLLRLQEEAALSPGVEAVVRGFRPAPDLHPVLVDDLPVGLGEALSVLHVPAEKAEERVDEVYARLRLVEPGGAVRGEVAV